MIKRVEKEGFEYRGYKLGQRIPYGKIIGFDTSDCTTECFIAVLSDNLNMNEKLDNSMYNVIALDGYNDSSYNWVKVKTISKIEDLIGIVVNHPFYRILKIDDVRFEQEKYFVEIIQQNNKDSIVLISDSLESIINQLIQIYGFTIEYKHIKPIKTMKELNNVLDELFDIESEIKLSFVNGKLVVKKLSEVVDLEQYGYKLEVE